MAVQVANKAWAGRDASGVYNQAEELPNPTKEPPERRLNISLTDLLSMGMVSGGTAAGMTGGALIAGAGGALIVFGAVALVLGVLIGLSDR